MKKLGLFFALLLTIPFALGDTTVPSDAKSVWTNQNLNRTSLYKPRSIFLADPTSYTLELKAPTLASDLIKFVLPSTNGSADDILRSDGAGATSWIGGTTARTALGLGINDSPQFNALSINTNLTLINQGLAKFNEATGNGTNYVALQAPASMSSDYTLTLPAVTDTLVSKTSTDTLTNKTLSASTIGGASNDGTDGFVLLKHQSSAAAAPGANDVKLYAASGKVRAATSTGDAALGSGSGELNYVTNPSDAGNWVASDANKLSVTTVATGLPRDQLTKTGIKILGVASQNTVGQYVYIPFTTDDVDATTGRVLKIKWDQKPLAVAPVAGNLTVDIVSHADHTTVLAVPANPTGAATTSIPITEGTFATTFVAPSTTALDLRIKSATEMADNAGLVISDVIVGPGQLIQGAPISDPTFFDPTSLFSSLGTGTVSYGANTVWWERVGKVMHVSVVVQKSGGTGTGANTIYFTLPSSLATDVAAGTDVGRASTNLAGVGLGNMRVIVDTSTRVRFVKNADTSSNPMINTDFTDTYSLFFNFDIPISGWSSGVYLGSGADNTAQMPLNWTAFTPAFTNIGFTATVNGYYRRVGDSMEVWAYFDPTAGSGSASALSLAIPGGFSIDTSKLPDGTTTVSEVGTYSWYNDSGGAAGDAGNVHYNSATTVSFRQDSSATFSTTGMTTSDYFSCHFTVPIVGWTAQQYQGAMLAGFAGAGVGTAGLVNNTSGNTTGTPLLGSVDGTSVSTGYVTEELNAAGTGVSVNTSTYTDVVSKTLTAGRWLCSGAVGVNHAASVTGALSLWYSKGVGAATNGKDILYATATAATDGYMTFPPRVVIVASGDADKTIKMQLKSTGANATAEGWINAVRLP
jgi:hypothetical protein